MSRERHFDEAEVLEKAADTFAVHGFSGTSVAMLSEATGLGKQSLYNTFGDKEALYLKAIECAAARYSATVARMGAAASGRAAIELFFEHVTTLCESSQPSDNACIVSAGLLEGVEAANVQALLERKWNGTHELLRSNIERGQKDKSVRNLAPSIELADMLMSIMSGLRVAARVEESRGRLQKTVQLALRLLDVA